MKALQLLCVLLGLSLGVHALAVTTIGKNETAEGEESNQQHETEEEGIEEDINTRSKKKQSAVKNEQGPEIYLQRLDKDCLRKSFTQSSCLKVFCLPWERCVDGKCLCKVPYQCPKNATSQVCTTSGRAFRSYCQQKSYECQYSNERFSVAAADCKTAGKFSISLKNEEESESQSKGIVQVYLPNNEQAKYICKKEWTTQEANAVCRQLGFNKGALPPVAKSISSEPMPDLACLQVKCRGHETSLAECVITDGSRKDITENPVEVDCYTDTRDCKKNEFQCVNKKCIPVRRTCDGINDCGDLSDELCCKECSENAFHCHSDTCIHKRYVCNEEFDCINGEDEFNCTDLQQNKNRATGIPVRLNMDDERKMIRSSLPALTCGIAYHRGRRFKRIIGGEKADKDQFPWQVAIKDGESVNCGGIYIGGCWVLTAAHCISSSRPQQYLVMVGLLDRTTYDNDVDAFPVIEIKVHQDYNPSTYENDIALLLVKNIYNEEKCIGADNAVMPACIPWSEYQFRAGDTCKVSGWGRSDGFVKVFYLKWGNINLMANCSEIYKERYFENMECAGTYDGSIDSCKGDSGGPLVCVDKHNVAYLWGIVSWGENCGVAGYPGVYTKVANYFEWISRHVGRQFISRYNV
ncbi:complement factor I isoform X2 [Lissotriton helveticus]